MPVGALGGYDIDHFLPRGRGGHDHPYNYFVMPAAANRSFRKDVTEMKVMLFAYYPPGVCWFDNIHIEPVAEADAK